MLLGLSSNGVTFFGLILVHRSSWFEIREDLYSSGWAVLILASGAAYWGASSWGLRDERIRCCFYRAIGLWFVQYRDMGDGILSCWKGHDGYHLWIQGRWWAYWGGSAWGLRVEGTWCCYWAMTRQQCNQFARCRDLWDWKSCWTRRDVSQEENRDGDGCLRMWKIAKKDSGMDTVIWRCVL